MTRIKEGTGVREVLRSDLYVNIILSVIIQIELMPKKKREKVRIFKIKSNILLFLVIELISLNEKYLM